MFFNHFAGSEHRSKASKWSRKKGQLPKNQAKGTTLDRAHQAFKVRGERQECLGVHGITEQPGNNFKRPLDLAS